METVNKYNMYARHLLTVLFLLLTAGVAHGQTEENVLTVPDFTGGINKTVNVPIHLSNSDEVVAAQFDITLPFAMTQNGLPTLSGRARGHSVNLHTVTTATNTYRVVVMNMQNTSLRGNAGLLLNVPMAAQDDGQASYTIKLSNVVLTDKKGHNIATSTDGEGIFTVSREDLPDLTVEGITLTPAELTPGGKVTIAFTAKNVGTGATRAGWTEKYYLEGEDGSRCYIGSVACTETLAANGSLQRSNKLTIPMSPHIDGQVKAVVELVPNANTGELLIDRYNNTGVSNGTATLGKQLTLTANKTSVKEGSYYSYYSWKYDYITMTLTRSGDWSRSETFTVNCNVSNLLTCNGSYLPANVTIPAGAAGVTFQISAVNDNIVRAKECDVLVSAAHGYEGVKQHILRVDNDLNSLQLNTSLNELHEGQQLTITATRGGELTDDLVLQLTCSEAHRFTTPRTIEIPAGKATGEVTLTAIHDGVPQLDTNVRFSASATDYRNAAAEVRLLDDDRPEVRLVLSPAIVAEHAGQDATTAIISRDRGQDADMRIRLTSNRSDVKLKNALVTIPAGEKSVKVPVEVIDNDQVDGTRTALLTAQLLIEAKGQYAPSGDRAHSTAQLSVTDDESPYLKLTSSVSTIREGSTIEMILRRYVASANGSLTVTLASSDEDLTVPATVTIPSGSYQTKFTVKANRNETEGDDRLATITAQAQSLEPAELTLRISDRTLPDAASIAVDYDEEQFYSGMPATIYAEIGNEGTAILPAGMRIDFYLATGSSLGRYVKSVPFTTVYTEKELAIGEVQRLKFTADVPQVVGNHWLYARLNSDEKIAEFSTQNNMTRIFKKVFVAAPFSVEAIQTDRESYLPGELVTVTGRMTGRLNGQTVRVTLNGSGQRTYSDTQIDADGSFKAQVPIDRSAAGLMTVNALALGQTEAAKTAQINVWNMRLSIDKSQWRLNENYPVNGRLTLRNTSGKTITGITLTHSMLPEGCELTLGNVPASLTAGETATIDYTVNPTKSMTGGFEHITLTAQSAEGATTSMVINYLCLATNGNITLSPSSINTTLLIGNSRQLAVRVINHGLKATGLITLNVPTDVAWLKSMNPQTLASLEPGASTTIYLQLTHQKGMRSGQKYQASIQLSPESGASRLLNIAVTVTGIEYSQLDVYAHDVFSKAGVDKQHVSGATVSITDSRTGKEVMTGLTDAEGHWMTKQLTQGTYTVELTAQRHQKVKRQLVIGPDEQQRMDVYLPYKAVMAEFVSDIDMETGEYLLHSYIDVDYNAPQAIILPTLPDGDDFRCNSSTFEMTLTNVGQRAALLPTVVLPEIPGARLSIIDDLPTVLYPKESYVVTLSYEGPEEGRHRYIATMLSNYSFSINGETFAEDDYYQMLTGCDSGRGQRPEQLTTKPEIPGGSESDDESGSDNDGNSGSDTGDSDINPWSALPSGNSMFRLEFEDQNRVMTDEPLHAVLTIKNGQEGTFDELTFVPMVSGYETYEDSTDVFTVTIGECSGMTRKADGSYSLAGNTTGILKLTFTPKPEAAVDGQRLYYVGGQLAYLNRGNAIRSSQVLTPDKLLTVVPQGQLSLTYFIQRDFLADDADTEQKEQTEPAQMAVMMQNTGATDLSDITVISTQPVVVNNTDEAELGYQAIYSEFRQDEQVENPAEGVFTQIGVDCLKAGETATARWMYTTTETGHVQDLKAIETDCRVAAKVTIEGVKELVRTVKASPTAAETTDEMAAGELDYKVQSLAEADIFLVNEIDDELGAPDYAWPADGSEGSQVQNVTEKATISGTAGSYTLTLTADSAGWVYGRLHDPTNGRMVLTKVVRQSDGAVISAANFWQTDRTMLTDHSVIYENQLQFADRINAKTESYTLTFTERPGQPLQLMNIRLYTADNTEVEDGGTTAKTVTRAVVEFTRPLKNLYKQYYMLTVGDFSYRSGDTNLTSSNGGATFDIDMSQLEVRPGQHTMTVLANKLKGKNGVYGTGTYTVTWTETTTQQVHVDIAVGPEADAGTVDKQTADYDYGRIILTAKPQEGYRFDRWTANGITVGTTEQLEYDINSATSLRAVFIPIDCHVTVGCDEEMGTITGFGSGVYSWGETMMLSATAKKGYVFENWLCDGEAISDKSAIRIKVDGNHNYSARFIVDVGSGVADVTAISTVDDRWYTLQGVCLGQKKPLRAGLYILQGRVISVK